jgi:hypothetical protein
MVRRQNRADQIRLRRGVNFIQMMLRFGLQRKLPDAFVESAVDDQIGTAPREALTRSVLTDGHFLRVAGARKLILESSSGIMLSVSPSTLVASLVVEAAPCQSIRYSGPFPLRLQPDRVLRTDLIKVLRLFRISFGGSAGRRRIRPT